MAAETGSLTFDDGEIIFLNDGSYRWLRVHRFRCDARASDAQLLDTLLTNERYQDMYIQPEDSWTPTGDKHGPYRLDLLRVDCFDAVGAVAAKASLRQWAEAFDGQEGSGFLRIMDAGNRVLDRSTSLWQLRDMRDTAEHEIGGILGDFLELVAIDRDEPLLTLLVASAD